MRTTRWIWTERPDGGHRAYRHGGVLGVYGKSKGFHCRASLRRFPRDWDKTQNGDSIFTRFGPATSRSPALKNRGIWVYYEAICLP